jgi:hypothetical protein
MGRKAASVPKRPVVTRGVFGGRLLGVMGVPFLGEWNMDQLV